MFPYLLVLSLLCKKRKKEVVYMKNEEFIMNKV